MQPALIFDLLDADAPLAGLGVETIIESQSVDSRPDASCFITISFEETTSGPKSLGPRNTIISVHRLADQDRDYGPITKILNRIDQLLLPVEQQVGSDGVRVSQIDRGSPARSGNMTDEGYNTIVRWATYRVSYDEFGA